MISIAIPTFNRTNLLYESFAKVINDPRISEIVIVDDCSTSEVWEQVQDMCHPHSQIKLYRNEKNLDCYRNKREAVSKASNEWVILLDSDNVIDKDYLDAIFGVVNCGYSRWRKYEILQPCFAKPHFEFKDWEGKLFNKSNIANFIKNSTFQTMLNAANYFVNRDAYLEAWDGSVDPVTSDSIYMAYRWLEAGNSIYVVPGLEYEHRVHEGSHYRQNVRRTPRGFHEDILNRLKKMR